MKTIAIANQKGGTGKTTTTYNLGIALTQQGYRVLMVDFDPQGNLSCYCGIPPEKDLDQTITELLMKTSCEKPIGNRECVYQTGRKETAARVDFIPSNLRLAGFELAMGTMMCREVLLKSCLEQYSKDGALDHGKLLEIMDTKKPSVPPRDPTLTISISKIARYFPAGYTQEQMVGIIMQLLERNSRHLMPEKQTSLER